ncbi:MAG: cobalt ECF transporter T component CbiQ [Planctomycetota bacterium]|nr:cobalt ECF transporter T component CbiQ [Planctomycetota bacterium]
MHGEEFSKGDSFIHRLDPRFKIVLFLAFALTVALSRRVETASMAFLISLILLISARLEISLVFKRLLFANFFVAFLWLFLPFSYEGQPLFSVLGFNATEKGLKESLLITLKCNAILVATFSLLATVPLVELGYSFSSLGFPKKLVHLFFFVVRYVFLLHEEYLRLHSAMRVRCFKPRSNLHTYRTLAFLAGMLLVRSFERAERIFAAMKCRAFKGEFYILKELKAKKSDALFATVFLLLILLLGFLECKHAKLL